MRRVALRAPVLRVATSFDGASRYLLVTGLSEDAEVVWDASKL